MSTLKNNNTDYLDQLLKDTFSDYAIPTQGNSAWLKIKKMIIKHQFLKFNLEQFNIYYLAIVTSVMLGVSSYLYFSKENKREYQDLNIVKSEEVKTLIVDSIGKDDQIENSNSNKLTIDDGLNTRDEDSNAEQIESILHQSGSLNRTQKNSITEKEIPKSESTTVPQNSTEKVLNPIIQGKDVVEKQNEGKYSKEIKPERLNANFLMPKDTTKQTALSKDSINQSVYAKPTLVIQTDTIVKVIKKRRRRKK